jgi:hypothetical protein
MPNDIAVKLPAELVERADLLVPVFKEVPEMRVWSRVTRTALIRLALLRGLESLEAEFIADPGDNNEQSYVGTWDDESIG